MTCDLRKGGEPDNRSTQTVPEGTDANHAYEGVGKRGIRRFLQGDNSFRDVTDAQRSFNFMIFIKEARPKYFGMM